MRLDFSQKQNRLAQALEARLGSYVDLTVSNPTAVGLPIGSAQLPAAASYDPQPRGLLEAREAVAQVHNVEADRIVLAASTSEAYSWLFKLLCDPGDEVLVPQPCYPLFDYLTALESVKAVPYALRYDGEWHLDPSLLKVSKRTKAVLIVSPGNPTGSYLKRGEYSELARLCGPRGIALISDEVFAEFPTGADPRRVHSLAALDAVDAFALSGLSKLAGLPQLKLGWIAASGPRWRESVARLELIADTYLSVSTPVQLAAPGLIAGRQVFQRALKTRLANNRALLQAARPRDASWDVLHSEGGWSAVLRVPQARPEEDLALELLEAGVLVHPGYFFDFPSGAHLVISLLVAPSDLARGLAILRSVL
ncbi:MAG TPA: pyridoxal phosphate-dependent aminotransferase [Myxococcales bacterium]|nr:pyridoxal phosphate-dependent aminotransferase [Myxococcales bacterium]